MRYREIVGVNDDADNRLRAVLSPEEYADVQRLIGATDASKVLGMDRLSPTSEHDNPRPSRSFQRGTQSSRTRK